MKLKDKVALITGGAQGLGNPSLLPWRTKEHGS